MKEPTDARPLPQLLPLHAFILTIPAVPPSAALRIAYYLNLTSFIAPALDGYTLLDETLDQLFDVLARFDRGWVAVLRGDDWDSSTGAAGPSEPSEETETSAEAVSAGRTMRTTDRARLESLIKQIRGVLALSLGLPQFVPLENDPFLEMLQHRQRPDLIPPIPDQTSNAPNRRRPTSTASTVSDMAADTSDAETDMSVDTVTDLATTPSAGGESDAMSGIEDERGADDDDDDDADFEEVAVIERSPSAAAEPQRERLPNAVVDPPSPDGGFEIHYQVPPPALHDGEITLQDGATPVVGQRKGFDPDAEYPLSEEEGEPIVPPGQRSGAMATDDGSEDDDAREGHEEDGIEDTVRERLKHVFELTERELRSGQP